MAVVHKAAGTNGEKMVSFRGMHLTAGESTSVLPWFLRALSSSVITRKLEFRLSKLPAITKSLRTIHVLGRLIFEEDRFNSGRRIRKFLDAIPEVWSITLTARHGYNDLFLRYCITKGIVSIDGGEDPHPPCKRVTDAGIVHFCFGGQQSTETRKLFIKAPTVTKFLIHRLVQVCA